ncbi:hypothetical protein ACFOHS_17400 [Jhaorihella thermophila]
MLVTDIEITHYHYNKDRARHVANVCLTLKDRVVSLFCQTDLPEAEKPCRTHPGASGRCHAAASAHAGIPDRPGHPRIRRAAEGPPAAGARLTHGGACLGPGPVLDRRDSSQAGSRRDR